MNGCTRRRLGLRRAARAKTMTAALAAVAAVAAVAITAAACGSSGSQGSAAQPGQNGQAVPTSMQVLTEVERGDLTSSVVAPVKVKSLGARTIVVATVPAESASAVAQGQSAKVMLFSGTQGGMPQPGQSGMPQGAPPSGMPQGAPSGMPQPGQSGMPVPQGSGMPQAGQGGGFPGGDMTDRGTSGTVAAVVTNADGTATATIRLDEEPADTTAESSGFASIQTEVLASDVIVIPTAAIKGSGSSATVEVMASGKTETRTVQVGQQSGSRSEIVSGLTEGENIVWYRSFPGFGSAQGQGDGQPAQGEGTQPGGTQ
jgi:membrane fusion protein, macrolide-specific efflux system